MLVVTSQDPRYLSNSYLVADEQSRAAVLVDGGTPTGPIHAAIEAHDLVPQRLFVTHRHPDHIAHLSEYADRYSIPICGHREEAQACGGFDLELGGGEDFECGGLRLQVLHIPGHTAGHLALFVSGASGLAVFTGDTLFRGSVGGTRGSGHTCFEDLRHSILKVLLALPPETVIYPGHTVPSTVAEELTKNLFVRSWIGEDSLREEPALFGQEPVTLLLRAPDYDGGTKCWIRSEAGQLDVVAGSRVQELT
jgi:hydroxyacylglutathione hydrolase